MDKITKIKQDLALYANERGWSEAVINLLEMFINNNVSYENAEQFCAEHFMADSIATYYKEFFDWVCTTKDMNENTNVIDLSAVTRRLLQLRDSIDELLELLK